MRKLLTILFFLISIKGFTQYPTNQSIGADSTLVTSKGGLKGRLVNWSFSDTTDANLQRIKYYPGAQIFTTTDTLLWFRSPLGNKWIQFFTNSGGSGGDTLVWKLSGNSVATRSVAPVLGTLTSDNLNFITYGVQRMIIPATGIVRNTAAVNKYLLLDTITKNLYYGDGGGSGSTPTWQQTLTAGSRFTQNNTASGAGLYYMRFDSLTSFRITNATHEPVISYQVSKLRLLGTNGNSSRIDIYGIDSSVVIESGTGDTVSTIRTYPTVVNINPFQGNLFIDTLVSQTSNNTLMGWTSTSGANRGKVGSVAIGTGLSLSSGVLSNTVTASSPAGNYGNIQLNRNGAFATPGSDSLDFESATGLSVKGSVNISDGQYLKIGGSNILNYSTGTNNASFAGAYNFLFNNGGNVFFGNTNQTYFSQGTGDLYFSSGTSKLGIGTTTPSQILHVNGTGQFGTAGTTIGKINISGNTSGTITIQPQAAAGTYNFNLPNSAGSTGYLLTSGGGGSSAMTWTDPSSFGFWKLSATSVIASDVFIDKNGNELTLGNSSPSQLYLRNSLSSIGDPEIIGNGTIVEVDDANQKVVIPIGNVGIGTSTPTGTLHVVAAATDALFVDAATGNVGVGTSTPGYPLHVFANSVNALRVSDTYFEAYTTSGSNTAGLTIDPTGVLQFSRNDGTDASYVNLFGDGPGWVTISGSQGFFISTNGTASIDATTSLSLNQSGGNVGIGTSSPTSTLTNNGSFAGKYTATATGITLDGTNYVVNVTATGQTITLPDAAGIEGRIYTIKLTASGSCTVATTSSQTIDASTTYSLASQYKYVTVQSDNANWIVIGNN